MYMYMNRFMLVLYITRLMFFVKAVSAYHLVKTTTLKDKYWMWYVDKPNGGLNTMLVKVGRHNVPWCSTRLLWNPNRKLLITPFLALFLIVNIIVSCSDKLYYLSTSSIVSLSFGIICMYSQLSDIHWSPLEHGLNNRSGGSIEPC